MGSTLPRPPLGKRLSYEGSCSPNLTWPQNLSTQGCRQPHQQQGRIMKALGFGQESINELEDGSGRNPATLPFCFGSSSTLSVQAKLTQNGLLPGPGEQRQQGAFGSHQSPSLSWCIDCPVSTPSVPVLSCCPQRGCTLGLPLSNLLGILTSACLCGFCHCLPALGYVGASPSQPCLACPCLRLYQCDTRGINTQVISPEGAEGGPAAVCCAETVRL